MPREAYVYRIVLDHLEKSKEPVTTSELVEKCKIPYSTVARVIRKLTLEKRVKRINGYANSYSYRFVTYDLPEKNKDLALPVGPGNVIVPKEFTAEQLLGLCEGWTNDGWNPAVTKSTNGVLESLSELYRWSLISASGKSISSEELKTPYDRLVAAKRAGESYLEFITGLMSIKELWDGRTFAAWLLSGTEDTDSVTDLADSLRTQSKWLNT